MSYDRPSELFEDVKDALEHESFEVEGPWRREPFTVLHVQFSRSNDRGNVYEVIFRYNDESEKEEFTIETGQDLTYEGLRSVSSRQPTNNSREIEAMEEYLDSKL